MIFLGIHLGMAGQLQMQLDFHEKKNPDMLQGKNLTLSCHEKVRIAADHPIPQCMDGKIVQ